MSKFYSGTIQHGSSGDDTKKWQEFLQTQGYDLSDYGGIDGIFGDKTKEYTIDWQGKNGLTADGIVGELTWGKAGYSNVNNPVTAPESTPFEYDEFNYDDYKESDSVASSRNDMNNANDVVKNFGDFNYSNQTDLDEIMNKILNREEFSYDLNGDALYQQYKDKYIQQGKMAMQDTMGQAAAMTGGYGNSYAASVGNQAYQASLENLNDIIPELYQMAYDRYNQQGQDLYNQYGMLSDDRNMEYGMWSDDYNRAIADRDYYTGVYDSERSYDYNKYADERNFDYGVYSDDRTLAYNTHRDSIEDAQWQANFDEALRQHEQNMALTKEQWDWQKEQAASSGSGTSGGGSSGGSGSGGSGGTGGSDNTVGSSSSSSVSEGIRSKAGSFSTNEALKNYLNGLVADGEITQEQAVELYGQNKNAVADYKDRNWTLVDGGGINWFGGVDGNATYIDQYGNKIDGDDLVDKLREEGMSKSEAKAYVKALQKKLGA